MPGVLEKPMGRNKKPDASGAVELPPDLLAKYTKRTTNHVRVAPDIAFMVNWVTKATGKRTAKLLDPILRASIQAMYLANKDLILRLQEKARERDEEEAEED